MPSLNYWMEEVNRTALSKGWDAKTEPFPEKLLLVVTEIAEAMEEYRQHHGMTEIYYPTKNGPGSNKPEGIPIELADAVIRIFDLCKAHGIDLEEAIALKNDFNKTRPFRHGGKKA